MNKIFKVIFSKAKGCYVVVSELAKSAGKGTSASHIQRGYSLTLAAAVLSMMMGMAPVGAAAPVDLGNNAKAAYDDKGNLTIGNEGTVAKGTKQAGQHNTTIGTDSDTLRNVTEGDTKKDGQPLDDDSNTVLVDGEGKAHDLTKSTEAGGSTAVGYNNHNEGDRSTAIGNTAKITNKPVVYYVDKDGNKTASAEDAVWYKDANGNPTKVPQVFRDADGNNTTTPQYVHTYTEKDPDTKEDVTKTEITSDATKADQKDGQPVYNYQPSDNTPYLYTVTLYQAASNSIAAGTDVTANGSNAVAVGYNSTADNSAVAIGDTAKAAGDNTIAIGTGSTATDTDGTGSIAIGKNVEANKTSTAVGLNGTKASSGSSAYGNNAVAENSSSAFGSGVQASGGSYASGMVGTKTDEEGHSVPVPITATNGSYATGMGGTSADYGGMAVGNNVSATKGSYATGMGGTSATNGSMAVGKNVRAGKSDDNSDGGAFAIGMGGTSADYDSMAIGNNVKAGNENWKYDSAAFAVGMGGTTANRGGMAVGNNVTANGNNSYAAGTNGTIAYAGSIAIGSHAQAGTSPYEDSDNQNNVAVGNIVTATQKSGAFGNSSTAEDHSYALGESATAKNSSYAIGSGSNASSTSYAYGNGSNATSSSFAIGGGANASGTSYAFGSGARASTTSYSFGGGANATNNALAVGSGSSASNYSYAFGSGANASDNSLAVGSGATSSNYGTAIGSGANATFKNSLALGNSATAGVDGGVALGQNSTVYRGATAGLDPRNGQPSENTTPTWKSTYGALSIGAVDSDGNATGTRQIIGVAAGTNDTDAVNVAQLKQVAQGFSIHDYGVNSVDTTTDTNYNNAGAQGNNSLAAGVSAKAIGDSSVAIGNGAQAEGKGATVIGKNAKATGQYATAFGGLETTDKKTGKTVNVINTASGASATAFGQGAQAKGAASLAFGHNTVAGVDGGNGQQSVAFGEDTQALGGRSLAFGEKTVAKYNDSVAFGNDTRASSTGATAFGNRTRALSSYSTAWGNATVAADEESTAWGTDTIAGAKLDENGAVTNNYKINPDDKNEPVKQEQMDVHGNLAYVRDGKTAGIKQMKIDSGSELHDYVVLAGKDGNTYVRDYQGSLWKVNVDANGTATVDTTAGQDGKVYNGQKKTSLAKTTVDGSEVDINPDNVLTKAHEGSNGYTIDGYANATAFGYSTEASGDNATAFGNDTKATGAGATAFGYKTLASGENATAFGESSIAAGKNSLAALGGTTTDDATNAAAIGNGAKATLADSVALGSGALANRSGGSKGYDVLTGNATTETSAAWVANANAIAIGNDTEGSLLTRQITGVAAGSQDTDAVNVAQLKAAGFKVTTQNDGSISSSILNGDTLDFEGRDNAIVSTSKDSRTITVAVSKTPTFDSATFYNPTGSNNEKVTIANGQVSAFNGDQKKRAAVGVDNQGNGTLFLVNDDLSQAHLYTQSSKDTGNDGITRMYYTSSTDNGGEVNGVHTIAVLDDGINYAGDNVKPNTSEKVVVKHKLNSTMDITGGADTNNLAEGNIGVVATPAVEDEQGNITQKGKLEIKLNKDLSGLNTVTAGNAKIGSSPADTLKLTENGAVTDKTAPAGSYVTGLENKDWDTTNPSYVSGRAATEDQLAKVSEAINNATTAAGKRTVVTVNDKSNPAEATPSATAGAYGDYDSTGGNLMIAAKKDSDGVLTYNIKLNDQLVIGQKGEPGVAGKDGKVTVETKGGTTVVIGHDGEPGKDGKDGLFVTSKDGADGKSGVSITGPDGVAGKDGVDGKVGIAGKDGKDAVSITGKDGVGHIGLTGPKGEKGADGTPGRDGTSIDILTDYGTKTLDSNKNVTVDNKEQASRIIYNDAKGPHEVATMDDGLKIGANAAAKEKAANPVSNKLNSTINIKGSNAKADHTYTDDNLTTTVEQDADGNTTVKVLMDQDITGNSVTVGKDSKDGEDGKAGYDGQEGSIGIAGKNGIDGKNGKQGITTTIIKTEKGQNGKDGEVGKQGAPGVDGKDITRIVYQNGQDGENGQGGKHVVATLDDGLKFVGDDGTATPVTKKLNDTLQIRGDGTYDATTKTNSGNIQTSVEDGTIKVALNDKINLHQDGSLTVGGDKNGDAANGQDPIVIKHFDDKTLDMITGVDKDGKPTTSKEGKAGDYVTGLDNKDWDVSNPTYVSGRAATEDQLKEVSNAVTKATETAGKHTVVTVEGGKDAGTTNYNGENLKLKVTDTAGQKTYDLKLNDNLSLGTVGKDGEKGTDGSIGLKGADGKSSIGLNGKDGISVIGKDGKNGVSITGSNGLNGKDGIDGKIAIGTPGKDGQPGKDAVSISGQNGEGHIGLTGPAGKDGKDASADIHVKNGQVGVDGTDGNNGKDGMDRIVYDDHNGKPHEVATMDDGMKFVGNDGQKVTRKLNETLSIKGGLDKDAVAKASTKNLGVRKKDDGLEIVMTDTPDFMKVTVGGDNKITIGGQTVTGKKADGSDADKPQTGNYITGLDNKAWDKDNIVENRAATEGQLKAAINDIKGSANGGFGLADGKGGTVKKDLGDTVTVKGDGKNIETTVKDGALEVSLKKDVDLGQNGSIKAGETTINSDGVDTNKVTIKDSSISISKDGINGGSKQITHVASGASEIIKGEGGKDVYKYDNDTNAANIGDVKRIAGDMKTEINNNISNVTNKVDQIGQHVDNIQKDVTQLQQDVKADRTYQGDDGAAKKVKVKFGSFLSLTGGAKLADLTEEGNIGVVQKEIEDPDHKGEKIAGLSVRLAKHLNLEKTTYTLEENGQTYRSEIDGKGLTINTGDANRNITVQDGNVNMGGNQIHHVAPGQAPDDAVNVSQLNATNYAVNKLDTRVNRVGANAAALAALHPLDFDPDDKWDFSAGYGHYKDANAAAVGAFYRPNEDTMFSVGGSFGGGENMVNAGVSVKLGQGNHVSTSRVAMAKEIKDLKKDVADLKAVVNQQSALIDKLTGVNAGELSGSDDLFPDVPANHWAYEYVTRLKQAGILTGYPDGNFAGDRMMTRYEFAAIVYRAIMAGAAANPSLNKDGTLDRLAKEFSSEMKYIRIDTIRKDRNGRPTIQRVRVIKEDEKEK